MTRWVETNFDYLTGLADPTGNGLITSSFFDSDPNPQPFFRRRNQHVTIRGVPFRSYKQAAAALNIDPSTVRKAALAGRADKLMPRHWWEVEGIEFRTIQEAADFFSMPTKVVRECAKKFYPSDPLEMA